MGVENSMQAFFSLDFPAETRKGNQQNENHSHAQVCRWAQRSTALIAGAAMAGVVLAEAVAFWASDRCG